MFHSHLSASSQASERTEVSVGLATACQEMPHQSLMSRFHRRAKEQCGTPMGCRWMPGWWYTYASEKYESHLGWLFPIYGKNRTCSKPPTRMPPDLNCFSSLSGTFLVWRWNFSVIFWTTGNRTLGDTCKSVSRDKVWIAQRTKATLEQPRFLIKMSSWPEALLRPVLVGPKFAILANTTQVFGSANKDQHLRHLSLQAWYAWLKEVKPCKHM